MMLYKKQLINRLITGQTEVVLKALTVLADQMGDNTLMNDVVNQYLRYQQLVQERNTNQINEKEYLFRQKKINQILILLIEQM